MADDKTDITSALLEATLFAADKHRGQRRKDEQGTPYINHPIHVANLLASVGGITDLSILQAGLLHDTVEDTNTSGEEIEQRFGSTVRKLVMEVTDDKTLEKHERKRKQIEKAPNLSAGAKVIKLADKIANLADIVASPPVGWSLERRRQYLAWSNDVIAGCRGHNSALETMYSQTAAYASGTLY